MPGQFQPELLENEMSEWVKWESGEYKPPTGGVEVILRDGTVEPTVWAAEDLDWSLTGDGGDITYYRRNG